ncbi:MAG: right-handed parallel beta-helix repeat-containing protein, partial [Armatimonadetes bacterium]|nr:right-handed parallel beta-helix repeat-containing protein [Armatimonadota bacterium]
GIACLNCESVEIRGNLLSDNTASSGAAVGGAIYCVGSQSAVVSNNRVEDNAGSGECGGIVCAAPSGTICNNLILANTASGVGGIKCAASVGADTNLSVVNNTIARNSGPGIKCDAPVTILVANNIIALNSAGVHSTGQASVSLRNNCLYGNSEYTYYGVSPGTGDMLSDPLVADLQSDNWRLMTGSPCIDAGDDASAPASETDIDGQARIFGAHIDIGADEYVPEGVLYGIAMVSLPIIPSASDPKQVMQFDGNLWFVYSPATKAYAAYPNRATWFEPTSATPGRGFWARFSQPVPLPTGGVPPQHEAVPIHLLPGWNIIGNPFMSPLRWDLSAMMVRGSTGVAKTYMESLNLVAPYAWGWRQDPADPYHGAYYAISDPSYMVGEDTLQPWAACWLKAKQACDLILPPPGGSPEDPPEPPPWP